MIGCPEKVTFKFRDLNGRKEPAEMGEERVSTQGSARNRRPQLWSSRHEKPCTFVIDRKAVAV